MSVTNVQGTDIKFNVQIVSSVRKNAKSVEDVARSEIDTGAISFLEIEDNLVDPGIKGYISLRNPFGILDRVRLLRDSERTFFLDINLEDQQSRVKDLKNKKISLLGVIENNSALSTNVTDDNILMKFEEAQTSFMKKTSLHKLVEVEGLETKDNADLPALLNTILVKWLNMISTPSSKDVGIRFIDEKFSSVVGNGVTSNIRCFWSEVEDSVYDVVYRIYRACLLNDQGRVPSLQITSSEGDRGELDRKFTLKELFTDRHREFIANYPTGGNFADVYIEEFTIVPETNTSPQNASVYNEVEKYNLIRADIQTAREKYWCNYFVTAHGDDSSPADLTVTNTDIVKFSSIVDEFEENDIDSKDAKIFSNIPVITTTDLKLTKVEQGDAESGPGLVKNQIKNQVKNSLIFLNDTITFNVKGQMYRKPGMFITIKGGEALSDANDPISSIWLVISIKHQFKEMVYENEVTAVRLFGNKDKYSTLVGEVVGD